MRKFIVTIFLLPLSISMYASGGSLYSRYGIGDLNNTNSALQLSMGGLGVSMNSSKYLNSANPASIFNIKNTKFGASLNTNVSMLDDGLESAMYSHVKFSGLHLAFPIKESIGMGFLLGMQPYSVVNYDVITYFNSGTDEESREQFDGSGGISKIFVGFSYLLPLDIAIGATFDYYTGNVQYRSSYTYSQSSTLISSNFVNDYKYKGLGTTLGIETPDLAPILGLEGFSNFRLGASYEISGPINTDTAIVVSTSIGENTFESDRFDTKIPRKLGLGLNFTFNEKYLVVLDYLYQPWSEFEHNGLNSADLRDLNRYSIGFEIGEQSKRFADFWELIKYRGGLSYEQSQYEINNTGINQIGFHAGISFPLGLDNTIDIGFMYGVRGTNDTNLLKENIFQATVSLNFGEQWFVRREW